MASQDLICVAIAERVLLRFAYNGLPRLAYPCAHGLSTAGKPVLRAHEVTFGAGGRRVGMGKLFLLASMSDLALTDEHFDHPPHGYRRGDRGMASIHCQL
jgi:hypothetical protein